MVSGEPLKLRKGSDRILKKNVFWTDSLGTVVLPIRREDSAQRKESEGKV